jgi:hypothetical protein
MLNTPLLFIIFNRPDTTKLVFQKIREAKPKQLFIAADGPRINNEGDQEKCKLSREIASKVDWECEVKTLFQDKNLGCGIGPSTAITWFFNNVEKGIILEDDCLPNNSFFYYCEEMLSKYEKVEQVKMIAGTNLVPRRFFRSSYFFSRLVPIWGWATWRRAWKEFDYDMADWENFNKEEFNYFKDERSVVESVFEYHYQHNKTYDSWDARWAFACFKLKGLTIIPSRNLIQNIGFGKKATHTLDANSFLANIKVNSINRPYIHPSGFIPDQKFDIDYLAYLASGPKAKKASLKNILAKLRRMIDV